MKKFGWTFGMVENDRDGQKCLEVCEIYDMRPEGFAPACIDWKQFLEDKKMILEDLRAQAKAGVEFWSDKKSKKIRVRRRRLTEKHKQR